jgi:galactonate dehydratase
MKITGIETFVVGTFHRNARRHWLLLKLLTDEGLYGLGDASLHAYDGEIESILRQWVDRYLVGQDPLHHERHWTRLYQDTPARGGALGSTALSGLDIALWDLKGKALGRPVYVLLGGPLRRELRVYANGWATTLSGASPSASTAATAR